jgi:hypothetical protein
VTLVLEASEDREPSKGDTPAFRDEDIDPSKHGGRIQGRLLVDVGLTKIERGSAEDRGDIRVRQVLGSILDLARRARKS